MLVMADMTGAVEASVGGLAKRAGVTREQCEDALETLMGPDPDSRDGTTGERVVPMRGGWKIINHGYYRDLRTPRQQADAERKARSRDRGQQQQQQQPRPVRGLRT
jgi:hypothetical protein